VFAEVYNNLRVLHSVYKPHHPAHLFDVELYVHLLFMVRTFSGSFATKRSKRGGLLSLEPNPGDLQRLFISSIVFLDSYRR
jgi:hypothetical protein